MGDHSAPKLNRYLPHALAATAAVILMPIGVVSLLAGGGLTDSIFVSGPVAMLMSLGVSSAGSSWWKKRRDSHDLVFSDLMIWGWLRRQRTERRISRAVELMGNKVDLPTERQVEYFKELARALEARDPYTHGHTRRVTAHAVAIAKRMGLPREEVAKVRTAAAIHDIGKLNTPREVLNKPGRLSDEEFKVIQQHPVDGAEIAARLGDEEITAMVLHHHERLDGTGYPGQLAGQNIPLGARIIAVADTFDAITSKRPYRGASSHKKAMAILAKEAGTQLDPEAVRAFRSHYSGLRGVAVGSLISSGPGQLLPWNWGVSSLAPLAKSFAALVAAGALGTTAASLARPGPHPGARAALSVRNARDVLRPASAPSGQRPFTATKPLRPGSSTQPHRRSARVRTSPVKSTVRRPQSGPSSATTGGGGTTQMPNAPANGKPSSSGIPTGSGSTSRGGGSSGGGGGSSGGGGGSSGGGGGSSGGGGGSSGGGGGSSSGGGATSTSIGPVSVSSSSPSASTNQGSLTATTPSTTVSTPPVTVNSPVGSVTTPPVGVSTPSATLSTPSVQTPPVSLP